MSRFVKSIVFVGIGLVLFTVARMALYLVYRESFSELSGASILLAFVNGLRFDLNVLLAAFVFPLVMMNLPLKGYGKRWFKAWSWVAFATLIPTVFILISDIVYFGYVQRHIVDELLSLGNDMDFIAGEALSSYLPVFIGFLAFMLLVGVLWRFVLLLDTRDSRHPVLALIFLGVFCFLGIRGSLDGKPIGLVDAFSKGDTALGNLTLNGVFSTYSASVNTTIANHSFMTDEEALAVLGLKDEKYPVYRPGRGKNPSGLNIVFLLLESWDRNYIDSYDGKGLGLTPNFDAIAEKGLKFENFYGASQRSVQSIQAILTGVPPVIGLPELGTGLKLAHITQIGTIAQKFGYTTLFIQSSKRRSYRLDSIARSLGFTHFYGQQDVPIRYDYPSAKKPKWGWDYDTFMFGLDKFDELRSPFLCFLFSGSTHSPYPDPGERFRVAKHSIKGQGGYLNTLHYSDWGIGEFMRAAQTKPWFEKTIFILTADHIYRSKPDTDISNKFRIPFVMYAPGILEPGVETEYCSHLDCLPTILDLLGFDEPYAAIGKSVFEKEDGCVLVKKGNLMGMISKNGSLSHSLYNRLETMSFGVLQPASFFDRLERRLLATVQVTSRLLRSNRWAPPAIEVMNGEQ